MNNIEVKVRTGSHLLAGTDSAVWIQLVGKVGRTQWLRLIPDEGSFSRNGVAVSMLRLAPTVYPGPVTAVHLQHDGSGQFKGWFVDSVAVDGHEFAIHRWLAPDEPPYRTDVSTHPEEATDGRTIRVATTELFLGGTDATVEIQLIGRLATTPWMRLWEPGIDNFSQGHVDSFRLFTETLGKLQAVWLRHDGAGLGAGWHVSWIEVDGDKHEVNQWLAADEGSRRLDHMWLREPLVRATRPLTFRLITFADLHNRARVAAAADIGHVGTMLERFGIEVLLQEEQDDVLLAGQWLAFDALHSTTESLISGLLAALVDTKAELVGADGGPVVPLFYIGGLEQTHGHYPSIARRPGGVFIPLGKRHDATLAHEVGRYFGLPHSSGRVDLDDPSAPCLLHNASDVIEDDPRNVMSFSKKPVTEQTFTWGQVQNMLLAMLQYLN